MKMNVVELSIWETSMIAVPTGVTVYGGHMPNVLISKMRVYMGMGKIGG